MTTIDLKRAREVADAMAMDPSINDSAQVSEAASLIRSLCDRESEARKLIQALAWHKHPTIERVVVCPACGNMRSIQELWATDLALQTHLHYPTCKLAAWLRGGKADDAATIPPG